MDNNVLLALLDNKGRIYSVKFKKADGTIRKMVCLDSVKKHLRGGVSTGNKDSHTTFDMQVGGYRRFRYDSLISIKISGTEYILKKSEEKWLKKIQKEDKKNQ